MARIRYIKPEFFEDTRLARLSRDARLLYIGLWCFMDRNGIAEADAQLIRRNIFPYEEDLNQKKIEELILELQNSGNLYPIKHSGKDYLYCPTFARHQKPHPKEPAKYPIPVETLQVSVQQVTSTYPTSDEPSTSKLGMGIGMGMGIGVGAVDAPSAAGVAFAPPASESLNVLSRDSGTQEILEAWKIRPAVQQAWLALYEPDWIITEIKKAWAWCVTNPKKAPRKGFARFMNGWLSNGWEKHRKTLPSQSRPSPSLTITESLYPDYPTEPKGVPDDSSTGQNHDHIT